MSSIISLSIYSSNSSGDLPKTHLRTKEVMKKDGSDRPKRTEGTRHRRGGKRLKHWAPDGR